MNSKERRKIVCIFVLFLLVAVFVDITQVGSLKNGKLEREPVGGEEKEVQLVVDVEGLFEDYEYELEVEPTQPTQEEAETYFANAIKTIDEEFQQIENTVPARDTYESEMVEADWRFDPIRIINAEGEILYEAIPEEGVLVNAEVTLTCGAYEKIYAFPFSIEPKVFSEEETMLKEVALFLEQQMSLEGASSIQLPTEINGKYIVWSEKKEYLTPQILLLEGIAVVLLVVVTRRKKEQEEKNKVRQMEMDYPDIVNQLSLLLEAGMNTRQAWNKLAKQYLDKKQKGITVAKPVYEAIVHMSRRFSEGESERLIYQGFSAEIPAMCYHRLIRILLGNMEKGTMGICVRLEEESRQAYEQRILTAKKLGEEASTKMLLPLMLMMFIVMGIVLTPALLEFQI